MWALMNSRQFSSPCSRMHSRGFLVSGQAQQGRSFLSPDGWSRWLVELDPDSDMMSRRSSLNVYTCYLLQPRPCNSAFNFVTTPTSIRIIRNSLQSRALTMPPTAATARRGRCWGAVEKKEPTKSVVGISATWSKEYPRHYILARALTCCIQYCPPDQ